MERKPIQLPHMRPWLCEYFGPDGLIYGITLYGDNPDQIENDNCERLFGLRVVGELLCTIEGT